MVELNNRKMPMYCNLTIHENAPEIVIYTCCISARFCVGLISDEKLVDLIDFALSADTINIVKSLREIMETVVDPLTLMSQLAKVITDILDGSHDFKKERRRRRFFKRSTFAKEDMKKLRQSLRTLSEAEKQLRMSNDKLTWLTAALLQLALDQQYMLPSSSTDTRFNYIPLVLNEKYGREQVRRSGHSAMSHRRGLDSRMEKLHAGISDDVHDITKISASSVDTVQLQESMLIAGSHLSRFLVSILM